MSSQADVSQFNWRLDDLDDKNFQIRGRTLFYVVVLLSVFLLLTLLFLYARWVCRFRPGGVVASSTGSAPPRSSARPAHGLDPVVINGFPIILHRSTPAKTSAEEAECCICLSIFQDGEKVKVLPHCTHSFLSECVDRWLKSQSNCPLCRVSLRADSLC